MMGMEVLGLHEVEAFFSDLAKETKDGRERLRKAADLVKDQERAHSSSRRVRGEISAMVHVQSLSEFVARIGPRGRWAFLGGFLEHGTRPHEIPNFHGHPGAIFHHPGARPHPFLEPAKEATEEAVVALVGFPPMLR